MGAATPERRLAVWLLRQQRVRQAHARDLLRESHEVSALEARERGFVTALVLGVVRTSGTLDEVVAGHLRAGIRLEPKVRDALRLSAYELLFLGTPARVAVSQGVELARLANRRSAGLANAILRRVAEEDVPRMEAARGRVAQGGWSVGDLALVGGLPEWLARQLARSLGDDEVARLVASLDDAPAVYVAGNAVRHDAQETQALLRGHGIEAEPTGLPNFFVLQGGGELARSGLVVSCDVIPCDIAAQLVAQAAGPQPASRVLEIGQGRGTKSILLENAALAKGGLARIEAIDSEGFKVKVARDRMARAGLAECVHSQAFDGRSLVEPHDMLPEGLRGTFDLVFVDAPCSGAGTMRRHPEIPWSLEEASVASGGELPQLQTELLEAAATKVAPGGSLVYATCSVLRAEDDDVVDSFLASDAGHGFAAESRLRTWETPFDCDGHFCVRMTRRA